MRTTITLDDGLLEDAKRRASERGMSLSQFVQEAVRTQLSQEIGGEPAPPFELITFSGPARPGVNLDQTSALLEADDIAAFGGSGRPVAAP